MKILIIIVAFMFMQASPDLFAAEEQNKRSYESFDLKGNKRWEAVGELESLPHKGKDIYLLTEKGKGYYSGFSDEISWISSLEFKSSKNGIRPLLMEKRVFSKEREPIAIIRRKFDFKSQKVFCVYEDLVNGKNRKKRLDFNGDVANRLILPLYVQNFLENGKRQKEMYFLTDEPRIHKVDIRVVKKEMIDISGEEKESYKLCLNPNIGLFNIFKAFLPKAYIWHLSKADFEWLKYRGPESNPTSVRVEIDTLD